VAGSGQLMCEMLGLTDPQLIPRLFALSGKAELHTGSAGTLVVKLAVSVVSFLYTKPV